MCKDAFATSQTWFDEVGKENLSSFLLLLPFAIHPLLLFPIHDIFCSSIEVVILQYVFSLVSNQVPFKIIYQRLGFKLYSFNQCHS